jgi:hypothetical protein
MKPSEVSDVSSYTSLSYFLNGDPYLPKFANSAASKTQALNSSTFTLPPLNGTLTPPELYDFHLQYSPNHPLFVYTKSGSTHTILWSKAVRSAHRAGRIVQSRLEDGKTKPPSCRPIVSILALSGMLHVSICARICLRRQEQTLLRI